jgi:mono/diheme cytochrome c family protein
MPGDLKEMTLKRLMGILALPALALALQLTLTPQATSQTAAATPGASVEHGRYLVENVGMCGQCHTPRNDQGVLQMDKWLKGSVVPVQTPKGYAKWAYKAPRIAGLPQHTDDEFVRLMTTGINRDGKEALPPMPPFRMTEADARAIAAYLRSLP